MARVNSPTIFLSIDCSKSVPLLQFDFVCGLGFSYEAFVL